MTFRTASTELQSNEKVSPPDSEELKLLDFDITKLQEFSQKPRMEIGDFIFASTILSRWLRDNSPMLKEVCKAYGIQLWFHGESDAGHKYDKVILDDAPIYFQKSAFGQKRHLGFKWSSLEAFLQEPSFFVDQKPMSHKDFIGFVRDKLGGGHFDTNRSQIQSRLKELTEMFQFANQNALYLQMHQLARGVVEAITTCGVVAAIRCDLKMNSNQTH